MAKLLTKQQILESQDLPTEEVEVKEWGGPVRLRTLSGKERDIYESAVQSRDKGGKIDISGLKVLLLSLTIVDTEGQPLFSNEDLDALNAKSSKAIDVLFLKAAEINGIGGTQLEELRKN